MRSKSGLCGRTYSAPIVATLCAIAFLAGRYMNQFSNIPTLETKLEQLPRHPDHTHNLHSEYEADKRVDAPSLSDTQNGDKPVQDPNDVTSPGPAAFDSMLRSSGLTTVKPPIKPGVSGNNFYTIAPFQVLSWHPRTLVYPNFIDKERCEHIVAMAKKRLAPSNVALRRGETAANTKGIRTSQGTFLDSAEDPTGVLEWVENRIAQVTMIPVEHGEPFNVLRYELEQHYEAHYDVFDPESYGPQSSMRVATMLIYLSEVEEGGETVLPLEGEHGVDRLQEPGFSYSACNKGMVYKPRMGDALLFHSSYVNGTFDRHSLHGGCPVKSGQKWVMTKWIRDKCYNGRMNGGCQ